MTLFTVQLELGPETRAMLERIASGGILRIEFGPKTLETVTSLFPKGEKKREGVESLLRKGVGAARGK